VPSERVLLVEDNEANLELATFLLEEAGFDVQVARDAAQAARALLTARPLVLLLDISLGASDGLSALSTWRADGLLEGVRVLAFTAHAMRGDRERFLAAGCDGYIPKPIDVGRFVTEVRRQARAARGGAEERA
jgi:CheY-like chemotaxis protein